MARTPTPGARDRLLDTAARLFNEHGVHEVGLQQIVDECGCGKNMLYREFASKDDLVTAWLQLCIDRWVASVDAVTRLMSDDPAGQIVAIVQVTAEEAAEPDFRGCALRNTRAEFRNRDHPAHKVVVGYLSTVHGRLRDLAEEAGASDPETLADRIMLVIDGLVTNGAALGPHGPARVAVDLASELVDAATGATTQH